MITVLDGLTGKNASEKVTYGGEIKTGFTDNAYFTDAADLITALNLAAANLVIANDTGDADTVKPVEVRFDNKVKLVVLYVQGKITGIDDVTATTMVHSVNLGTKAKTAKSIKDFSAKEGKEEGTMKVRKVIPTELKNKKKSFVFQICTDPTNEDNWSKPKVSNKATVIFKELVSGTRYYFRVAIVVGDEQGDFSDVISKVKT